MTLSEAKKNIKKTNALRKKLERLRDRLMREPMSGLGFVLCQKRIKEAEKALADGSAEHRKALKVVLGSRPI